MNRNRTPQPPEPSVLVGIVRRLGLATQPEPAPQPPEEEPAMPTPTIPAVERPPEAPLVAPGERPRLGHVVHAYDPVNNWCRPMQVASIIRPGGSSLRLAAPRYHGLLSATYRAVPRPYHPTMGGVLVRPGVLEQDGSSWHREAECPPGTPRARLGPLPAPLAAGEMSRDRLVHRFDVLNDTCAAAVIVETRAAVRVATIDLGSRHTTGNLLPHNEQPHASGSYDPQFDSWHRVSECPWDR